MLVMSAGTCVRSVRGRVVCTERLYCFGSGRVGGVRAVDLRWLGLSNNSTGVQFRVGGAGGRAGQVAWEGGPTIHVARLTLP